MLFEPFSQQNFATDSTNLYDVDITFVHAQCLDVNFLEAHRAEHPPTFSWCTKQSKGIDNSFSCHVCTVRTNLSAPESA